MKQTTVRIPSTSRPSRAYAVRMTGERAVGCSCDDRRSRPLIPCTHMRAAEAPAEIARLTTLAQAAINGRLRYAAPGALRSVTHTADGGFLVVTNSGGNMIAVWADLRRRGYDVSYGDEANSVYVESW